MTPRSRFATKTRKTSGQSRTSWTSSPPKASSRNQTQSTQRTRRQMVDRAREEVAASAVIGAAIEVHRTLGPGFMESLYEEAMAAEMRLRGIAFSRQPVVEIGYKGVAIGEAR